MGFLYILAHQGFFVSNNHDSTSGQDPKKEWISPFFSKVQLLPAHNGVVDFLRPPGFLGTHQSCKLWQHYFADSQNINLVLTLSLLLSCKAARKHHKTGFSQLYFVCNQSSSASGIFGHDREEIFIHGVVFAKPIVYPVSPWFLFYYAGRLKP